MMPSDISVLLITPLRPRMTTQAKARTRKLVQKDSSTQKIRRLFAGPLAMEIR